LSQIRRHQPLREHAQQAAPERERVEAHLQQPRHRLGRAVGVQRREHQVARQRRLDRRVRRLAVADLADHHDVRVAAQERPAARGRT
jgi:hypothetical protein